MSSLGSRSLAVLRAQSNGIIMRNRIFSRSFGGQVKPNTPELMERASTYEGVTVYRPSMKQIVWSEALGGLMWFWMFVNLWEHGKEAYGFKNPLE